MHSTTKKPGKLSFRDLPRDYASLCQLHLPRPVKSKGAHTQALGLIDALLGYELSRDQTDYLEALTLFVHEYEQQFASEPELNPLEVLKHLLADNGLVSKDLAQLLEVDPSQASRLLSGTRKITPAHAKRLGEHFGVRPGLFVGL
jgi:antitoxin component HigA of HigAB toxin-antitoxin module